MKTNHFNVATKELKEKYQVDIIEDVLLGRKERVILYGDTSNRSSIILKPISGDLRLLGFSDFDSIDLCHILDNFDNNSKYSEIAGRREYYEYVTHQLNQFNDETDITFPIQINGHRIWLRFNIYPIEKNKKLCIFIVTNVSDLMNGEELIYEKTHKDALTGLFNRYTFDYHYGLRYQWKNLHALYMDLDDFKLINDIEGHAAGNEFLVQFSTILKSYHSEYNLFYRLGGDEFVGLFFEDEATIKKMAEEIITKTQKINLVKNKRPLSVSIGIVKAVQADDLIHKADEVLYKVKNAGKNHYLYEIEK